MKLVKWNGMGLEYVIRSNYKGVSDSTYVPNTVFVTLMGSVSMSWPHVHPAMQPAEQKPV